MNIWIDPDLLDRIDAVRPTTISREVWVRQACEERLLDIAEYERLRDGHPDTPSTC